MATNILVEHETEVADAIREKTQSSGKINPQDFAARIKGITPTNFINIATGETYKVFDAGEDGWFCWEMQSDCEEGEIDIDVGGIQQGSYTFFADYLMSRNYIVISVASGRVRCYVVTGSPTDDDPVATVVCSIDTRYEMGSKDGAVTLKWFGEESVSGNAIQVVY